MIALEFDASVEDHRIEVRSELLPERVAHVRLIVQYEEEVTEGRRETLPPLPGAGEGKAKDLSTILREFRRVVDDPASPVPHEGIAPGVEEERKGPLAELRSRVPRRHGCAQPMKRSELYDRACLR